MGNLEHAVGKRRFPVVDVGDDTEISDMSAVHMIGSILARDTLKSETFEFCGNRLLFVPEFPMERTLDLLHLFILEHMEQKCPCQET